MQNYLLKRFLYMLLLLFFVSIVSFIIIQLPPGDFLTTYTSRMAESGSDVSKSTLDALTARYGLDQPLYVQYLRWIGGAIQGDFGVSFEWNKPVSDLIGERLLLTIIISITTLIFTYALAIPIGVYSATHQYSRFDYLFTVVGFIGLAIPNFLLALILMVFFLDTFGISPGGLVSPEYLGQPFSIAKLIDIILHLPIPVLVIGTSSTAGLIRVTRGMMLDELQKQYVETARAKGLSESNVLIHYPLRLAINPLISMIGWQLPRIVSGATITAVVLGLPTIGPLLLRSLLSQDMYLAATILMLLSFLTIIGTFISDLLLVWLDPRIRY